MYAIELFRVSSGAEMADLEQVNAQAYLVGSRSLLVDGFDAKLAGEWLAQPGFVPVRPLRPWEEEPDDLLNVIYVIYLLEPGRSSPVPPYNAARVRETQSVWELGRFGWRVNYSRPDSSRTGGRNARRFTAFMGAFFIPDY